MFQCIEKLWLHFPHDLRGLRPQMEDWTATGWIHCVERFVLADEVHDVAATEKDGMFPQIFHEFGVIARKPGNRSDGFKLNLEGKYDLLPCKFFLRLVVIEVHVAKSKLVDSETKKIVRVEEKSVDLWIELLKTFCPTGGVFFMVSGNNDRCYVHTTYRTEVCCCGK